MFDGRLGTGWRIFPRLSDNRPDLWALRYRNGEGNTDLGAAFANPAWYRNDEPFQYDNIVLWYRSNATYERPDGCPQTCREPVIIGPIFKPFAF
jgi:hypothetical protein